MRKLIRKKIKRDWLENQLAKYERRIQRLAQEAYYIRQALEMMDAQEAARNKSKSIGIDAEVVEAATQTNIGENYAVCGNATSEELGSESDTAGEGGGFVRSSLHTDATEMDSQPKLDDVEPNPSGSL